MPKRLPGSNSSIAARIFGIYYIPLIGESTVIIEEYIRGRELTCAVIDNKPSMVMEIKTKNNFYDYNSKYCEGGSTHLIPAPIPELIYNQTKEMTIRSHNLIGCRGITRADFIFGKS